MKDVNYIKMKFLYPKLWELKIVIVLRLHKCNITSIPYLYKKFKKELNDVRVLNIGTHTCTTY